MYRICKVSQAWWANAASVRDSFGGRVGLGSLMHYNPVPRATLKACMDLRRLTEHDRRMNYSRGIQMRLAIDWLNVLAPTLYAHLAFAFCWPHWNCSNARARPQILNMCSAGECIKREHGAESEHTDFE